MDDKFADKNFKFDRVYGSCICPAGVEIGIKINWNDPFLKVTFPEEACLPCRMRNEKPASLNPISELISVQEAATTYHVSHATYNRQLHSGRHSPRYYKRVGRAWCLSKSLAKYIAALTRGEPADPPAEDTDFSQLLSMPEAAARYDLSHDTITRACKNGKLIPGIDCAIVGKNWVISRAAGDKLFLGEG